MNKDRQQDIELPPLPPPGEEEEADVERDGRVVISPADLVRLAERRLRMEQEAMARAIAGESVADAPREWQRTVHFPGKLKHYSEAVQGVRNAAVRSGASNAGKKSAVVKQDAKAERIKRWNEQAAELKKKKPGMSKEDIVSAIAGSDPDVQEGIVGANAILRAIKIGNLK